MEHIYEYHQKKKVTFGEDDVASDGSGISLAEFARHLEAEYHATAAANPDWSKSLAQYTSEHLEDDDLWQVFPDEARELNLSEPIRL